jgi:uncharacterized phage protein (predicted DNA packaging)
MAILDKVKLSLKVDDTTQDTDIQDTIDAAKADLKLSGVLESKIVDTDPLIIRAVKTYCKAEYSSDDREATRFKESYNSLKAHLSLSQDYITEVVV